MNDTDKTLVEAIHQVAQAKVAEALGGDVLLKIVSAVMEHKDTRYGSDQRTALEKIIEDQVHRVVTEEVRSYIDEHREEIELAVRKALVENEGGLAIAIVDAFKTDDWRATMNIEVERHRD